MSQRAHTACAQHKFTEKFAAEFPLVHNFPMLIETIHFAHSARTHTETNPETHTTAREREREYGTAKIVIRIVRRFSRMWIMRMARSTSCSHQNQLQYVEWMAHTIETCPLPTYRHTDDDDDGGEWKVFSLHLSYTWAPFVMFLQRLCGVCVCVECARATLDSC